MKIYAGMAGALLAAFLAALGAHLAITARYAQGMTPWITFAFAAPTAKLIMTVCILLGLAAVVVALVGLRAAATRSHEALLRLLAGVAVTFGVLGVLYGEMIIRAVEAKLGPQRFEVTAPGHAEALLTLAFGLFAGSLAMAGAAVLSRRGAGRA